MRTLLLATYGDGRRASAIVTLSRHDLVVERAEVQTEFGPSIEVVRGRDCAGGSFGSANGPILVEGGGALN